MSEPFSNMPTFTPPGPAGRRREVCRRFEEAWAEGPPRIEDFLGGVPEDERAALLGLLVQADIQFRRRQGLTPRPEDYLRRFPRLNLAWLDAVCDATPTLREPLTNPSAPGPPGLRCPHCHHPVVQRSPEGAVACRECGSSFRVEDVHQASTVEAVRRLGRFQLLEEVGRGSFGRVWRARDTELDRVVALKVPHESLAADPDYADRCRREAQAAARLRHPGIVRLYEVVTVDGAAVLVSDFIAGAPLKDLLAVRPLTFREAAAMAADLADALDYAHGQGLVHRDVKPGNVLVESPSGGRAGGPGRPILVDFGLALREDAAVVLTVDGQIIGTPAYMSPEQAAGRGHWVDRRSDVYSLGVILYEMLCGERPFRGSRAMLVHQLLHEEPRPPRAVNDKIPRDLQTVCLKAMAKEPNRRYATAGDLAADLRRFLRGEPVLARPAGRVERCWRWCARNPVVASLLLAVALTLAGGTAGSLYWAFRATRGEQDALDQAGRARAEWRRSERRRYAAEMNLAEQDWRSAQVAHLEERLARQGPPPGEPDLRGFEWYWLRRQCRDELYDLAGHVGPVTGLAVSPDGRWLASAAGTVVTVWDIRAGQEQFTLSGHRQLIRDLAFGPDGLLASSAADPQQGELLPGEVKVWDLARRRELLAVTGHAAPVMAVAFSRDGRRLACAGGGHRRGYPLAGEVKVWDIPSGQPLLSLSPVGAPVLGVAFSPDGRRLATAGEDGAARVWDATAERPPLLTLRGPAPPGSSVPAPVSAVAFNHDGSRLASGTQDGGAWVWDAAAGKEPLVTLDRREGPVHSVAFSPDGQLVATASSDRTVAVWDAATGEEVCRMRGHDDAVLRVAFSPDGWRLASASADRSVKVWVVPPAGSPAGDPAPAQAVVFRPDGGAVAAAGSDRAVRVWDTTLGTPSLVLRGPAGALLAVAFGPDGRLLASAGRDGVVWVWDASTGKVLRTLSGHGKAVTGLAFGAGPHPLLASAREDGTVRVWDATTGETSLVLKGHGGPVRAVAFRPDGRRLASAGQDGRILLWDLKSPEPLLALEGHRGVASAVAFSPDGRLLASGGEDQAIRLWDADTGGHLRDMSGRTGRVHGLAFGSDERLASAGADGSVRIWDANLGQQLLRLEGFASPVTSLAFAPDGRALATGSQAEGLKLWDASPASADQGARRQALALVNRLFRQPLRLAEVLDRVRGDETITDAVRLQALALAEPYGRGLVRGDADALIRSLHPGPRLRQELLDAVLTSPGVADAVRQEALAQAGQYVENAELVHRAARDAVSRATAGAEVFRQALLRAEAACSLSPDNREYLTTLGMARYRLGDYPQALDALQRARRLYAGPTDNAPPTLLAFLSMAQNRQGKESEARATLERLRWTVRQPPWATKEEEAAALAEAEAEVASQQKPSPK